jgi:hypothetical protein
MGLLQRFADPRIGKHLLRDEGEVIVDEVGHHWVVYTLPALEVAGAVALLCATPFVALGIAWLPMLIAFGVALHALWGALSEHMDRFVVTNMRVFRVQGVLGQQVATMPLSRILDITVTKPLRGRVRRPGAGAARHPLRRPSRRARPGHPAGGRPRRPPTLGQLTSCPSGKMGP